MVQNPDDSWLCVIIDNGSDSEATRMFLESLDDPRFHVIRNESNRGYGTAANQGVAYGLERGAQYVIVCNNDLEFLNPNWIEDAFLYHLRQNPKSIVGARYIPDNQMVNFAGTCVPYLEGYLFAMTAEAWRVLGGFDENFVAYVEDVDLCYRAVLKGYALVQSDRFQWIPEGGLVNARPAQVDVHHIGGRTGYNRLDFDFPAVTRQSIEYFKQKHGFAAQ
jgi:GT2 family glycosyltransferase